MTHSPIRVALCAAMAAIGSLLGAGRAGAQSTELAVSTDVAVRLPGGGIARREQLVALSSGRVVRSPAADIDGWSHATNGDRLVSYATQLGAFAPDDVVRIPNVGEPTVEFRGSPAAAQGRNVDAVSLLGFDEALLVSFDVATKFGSVVADDEDLVRVEAGVVTGIFFDGSEAGVPAALDLDGAEWIPFSTILLLSFDGGGTVGGVTFEDEDLLSYNFSTGAWALWSGAPTGWERADVDVVTWVPEPAAVLSSLAALGALALCRRRRLGLVSMACVASMVASAAAHADEGRIEISHALAIAGGVTAGDAPGYPVTLSQPGSYVLTSSLYVRPPEVAEPATAIEVLAADDDRPITIDLNGFALFGSGAGLGIDASNRENVAVRDGTITGFETGVYVSRRCRISDLRVVENGGAGLLAIETCLVERVISVGNGRSGIAVDARGIVTSSVIADNDWPALVVGESVAVGNVLRDNAQGVAALGTTVIAESVVSGSRGGPRSAVPYGISCAAATPSTGRCLVNVVVVSGNGVGVVADADTMVTNGVLATTAEGQLLVEGEPALREPNLCDAGDCP